MLLLQPTLSFAVHEDGMLELTTTWLPLVAFPESWIQSADGRRLVLRGDELEISCINGRGATYQLGELDPAMLTRPGRLARSR